ncbi:hypothetical protein RUM43_014095 [Polyplax serrata]|uniref:Ima1 N-terminal domain-containing protein n=1 Tax=Polyplax serrata TaxID=468196 RepID=A0AAN8RZQ8_POLSC
MELVQVTGDIFRRYLFYENLSFTWKVISLLSLSVTSGYLLLIGYQKIRRKFPIKVNCWFCCTDVKVPYELYNNWDCPSCQQYNGFNKDGGYNKVIKEQFNSKLNNTYFNKSKKKKTTAIKSEKTNGFCKLCNINQQLKIQQLALFVPISEENYDTEVEDYREKLEKAYKLCTNCEDVVKTTLDKQGYCYLQTKLNDQGHTTKFEIQKNKNLTSYKWKDEMLQILRKSIIGMRWILLLTSTLLFCALVLRLDNETKFVTNLLPNFVFLDSFEPYFQVIIPFLRQIDTFCKEIAVAGFLGSIPITFQNGTKAEQISMFLWGFIYLACWTKLTILQTSVCGLSLFFNQKLVCNKRIYVRRQALLKKSSFQPQYFTKYPSTENLSNDSCEPSCRIVNNSLPRSVQSQDISANSLLEQLNNQDGIMKRKTRENETESSHEGQKTAEPVSDPKGNQLNSVFKKSFLSSLEVKQNERETSPGLDDVYTNLSGLSLGKKKGNVKKRSNFLFENHNFLDKKSSSSPSVIKPAKFIKNLSNSWTCAESNESISRSSTPSSGYSCHRPDSNRFDFAKTISPISVNTFHRRDYLDCFETNGQRCYNFNCCPHEFIPLHQYPTGPLSHAAVYTYSRPTGFPFEFPSPSFSTYKYTPSSPRISDVSDCDNLFQNASRNLETSKRWFRLKTISYYLSILLNFLTLLCLIYFLSVGVISVELNLPKINFFV